MAAFLQFGNNPRLFDLFLEESQRRIKRLVRPNVNAWQNLSPS